MLKTIQTFWTDFEAYEHIAELKNKEIIRIKKDFYKVKIDNSNKDNNRLILIDIYK